MVTTNGRLSYNDDDVLSSREIAKYLHVSLPYAIKLIKNGDIPGGQLGAGFRAYFKYIRDFEEKIMKGGEIQRTLPLEPVKKAKRTVMRRKKAGKK